MDFTWSGMRDYAREIIDGVQAEFGVPDTELFTKFKDEAAARVAAEIGFGTLEETLEIFGKTREEFDNAYEEFSQRD